MTGKHQSFSPILGSEAKRALWHQFWRRSLRLSALTLFVSLDAPSLDRIGSGNWILKLQVYPQVHIVLWFLEQKMANYDRSKSSQMVFDGSVEKAVIYSKSHWIPKSFGNILGLTTVKYWHCYIIWCRYLDIGHWEILRQQGEFLSVRPNEAKIVGYSRFSGKKNKLVWCPFRGAR